MEKRAGPLTGAKIILLLSTRPMSARTLAETLDLDESYVRETLTSFVQAGLLRVEIVPRRKTRPVKMFSIADPPAERKK